MAQKPPAVDDDAEIERRMTEGLKRALSMPHEPHKPKPKRRKRPAEETKRDGNG